ncbi:glycosyltransferase family 4 protein [Gynuella sp.]|uniref:glycosyltransferase family 4 protein n=1 Tax=Gynuella sp. TaxID=2969146 RepID=UPI003D12DB12
MRYLVVSRSIPLHQTGGMEYFAQDTARFLVELGHQVVMLTTEFPDNKSEEYHRKINFELVGLKGCRGGKYSMRWWQKSLEYFKIRQEDFDCVISVSTSALSIAQYAERTIPVIMQSHGTSRAEIKAKFNSHSLMAYFKSVKNVYHLFLDVFRYKHFDAFIAVGDVVFSDLQKWPLNISPTKCFLVRNGVHRVILDSYDGIEKNNVAKVCWISRLHRQKGVHLAIEAFKDPGLESIELHIAGGGPDIIWLKKKAYGYKNIIFHGNISRESVYGFLNRANVFLFTTTRIEGYPLNILEALASGLPVVVSEHLVKYLPEIDGIYSVNANDTRDIALKIKMALSGTQPVLPEEYYVDNVLKKYDQICKKLCRKRKL